MNAISFMDLMKKMWNGESVDLTYVKYSATKKTGGQIRHYAQARLNIQKEKQNLPKHTRVIDLIENKNYNPKPTVHIILPSGEVRTIYRVGIIQANNQTVII